MPAKSQAKRCGSERQRHGHGGRGRGPTARRSSSTPAPRPRGSGRQVLPHRLPRACSGCRGTNRGTAVSISEAAHPARPRERLAKTSRMAAHWASLQEAPSAFAGGLGLTMAEREPPIRHDTEADGRGQPAQPEHEPLVRRQPPPYRDVRGEVGHVPQPELAPEQMRRHGWRRARCVGGAQPTSQNAAAHGPLTTSAATANCRQRYHLTYAAAAAASASQNAAMSGPYRNAASSNLPGRTRLVAMPRRLVIAVETRGGAARDMPARGAVEHRRPRRGTESSGGCGMDL